MIRKKGNLIILAFSVIVVSILIFPVSAGLVTINNSVHLNYSITGGPLYMNSQNSSVEVSTTNYYGSHINFSGTMPYYKSGSSANFSDFGAIIAKSSEFYSIHMVELSAKNISNFQEVELYGYNSSQYASLFTYKSGVFKEYSVNITQTKGVNLTLGVKAVTSTLSGEYVRYTELSLGVYLQLYTNGTVYQAFSYSMNLTFKIDG